MKQLMIAILAAVSFFAGAYLYLATGHFNVAANSSPDLIDRLVSQVRDESIGVQVKKAQIPEANSGVPSRAQGHYKEQCLPCHGAPGAERRRFADGMNPAPPSLDHVLVQRRSNGELFWIIKNGVRMSGMPAFGGHHSDQEIQDIVAFVRHLTSLSDAERQNLLADASRWTHVEEDHSGK